MKPKYSRNICDIVRSREQNAFIFARPLHVSTADNWRWKSKKRKLLKSNFDTEEYDNNTYKLVLRRDMSNVRQKPHIENLMSLGLDFSVDYSMKYMLRSRRIKFASEFFTVTFLCGYCYHKNFDRTPISDPTPRFEYNWYVADTNPEKRHLFKWALCDPYFDYYTCYCTENGCPGWFNGIFDPRYYVIFCSFVHTYREIHTTRRAPVRFFRPMKLYNLFEDPAEGEYIYRSLQ